MNDFLVGHIGQVSYDPTDDEEANIGHLDFSRACEQRKSLPENHLSLFQTFHSHFSQPRYSNSVHQSWNGCLRRELVLPCRLQPLFSARSLRSIGY